jgi:hypothetical protein
MKKGDFLSVSEEAESSLHNYIERLIFCDAGNEDSAEHKLKGYRAQVIADGKTRALPETVKVSVNHAVKWKSKPILFGLHSVAAFESEFIKIRRISCGIFEIFGNSARLSWKNTQSWHSCV